MSVLKEESVHGALECQERVSKGIFHGDSRCRATVLMALIAICLAKMMTKAITVHRIWYM